MQRTESTSAFTLNLLEGFIGTTDMRVEYRTGGGAVMYAINSAANTSNASAGGSLSLTLTSLQLGSLYNFSLFFIQTGSKTEICGTFNPRKQTC